MALKKDGVHFVLFPTRGYKVEGVVLNNIGRVLPSLNKEQRKTLGSFLANRPSTGLNREPGNHDSLVFLPKLSNGKLSVLSN